MKHINDIRVGELIMADDRSPITYVHAIEKAIENGREVVKNLILLPFTENGNLDSPEDIEIAKSEIQDKESQAPFSDKMYVHTMGAAHTFTPPEDNMINSLGRLHSSDVNIVEETVARFGGIRVTTLLEHDDTRIRGTDWDRYTGGRVVKELHLDGTEMPEKPQAPKKPRVQKAKSVVNVPDIYLEDAVQYGMLDFSAYQDLQKQRKKFVTLRDAWLEANKNSEALKKIASAANFDVSFSSGSYEEVYDDAIYQTAEKQEITLDEAVEKGWISQTTADILENGTGEENDSSQILLLSEAFELVAVDPEYLSEYRDPNLQRDVTLSAAKQRKIVTEMKNAYAKFSQENAQESLVDSINKSWRAFGREQIDLLDRNIAFRRHDPERAVIKSLENIVENQNAEIIGARPEMLSRAP